MSYKTPDPGINTQDTIYDFIVKETYITMSKHSQIRWVIKHLRQEHILKTQRYDYVVK